MACPALPCLGAPAPPHPTPPGLHTPATPWFTTSPRLPRLLPQAQSKIRPAQFAAHPPIKRGDTLILAGLTKFLRLMQRKSTVTSATSALAVPTPEVPRCAPHGA